MPVSPYLLLPLVSSMVYVIGALLLKRSSGFGVGLWRTTFVANLMHVVCLVPFWGLGEGTGGGIWWQPMVTGLLFMFGQVATLQAIEKGDVSVATPVLGTKIILVALVSALLLPDPIPMKWWIAAGLSVVGIELLNRRPKVSVNSPRSASLGPTIVAALGAAVAFAFFDVLVQKWAPLWGVGKFLSLNFIYLALWSLALIPAFSAPLRDTPRPALPWLIAGSTLLGLQAAGLTISLGTYGDATAINVVYSTRGLWSVLAVWWIGHWFNSDEQHLGDKVLRLRFYGAGLMLLAVGLVLV
ncbi:MAG: DMT family transporter [Synoicihabitans sp.]